MNVYQLASLILAIVLYIRLAYQVLTKDVQKRVKQNLASFVMWGLLDGVVSLSLFVRGGNYSLPSVYVLGCTVIIVCILISGHLGEWTKFDKYIVTPIFVTSVAVWTISGSLVATTCATIGGVVAGWPQLRDTWKKPGETPFLVNIGALVTNLLGVAAGRAWTMEERLYPTACALLCVAMTYASGRQFYGVRKVSVPHE